MADGDLKKINVASSAAAQDQSGNDDDPFADTKKELATRFELLPEDLQKVIVDEGYQVKLFNIAKASKLTYEELGSLEIETTMVLLGMVKPSDYRDELQIQLKKNDAEIDQLVSNINAQIFDPIKVQLEKLYATKKEPEDFLKDLDGTEPVAATAQPAVPAMAPAARTPFFAPKQPAPRVAVTPSLSPKENTVLASTGVILTETPQAAPTMPQTAMPNRTDVLKGIENPPKAPAASIVSSKLSTPSTIVPPAKTTDYSIPKTVSTPQAAATPVPPKPTADPYREPIQ